MTEGPIGPQPKSKVFVDVLQKQRAAAIIEREDLLLGKWNAFLDANILPNLHNLVITLHTLYPVKPFLLRFWPSSQRILLEALGAFKLKKKVSPRKRDLADPRLGFLESKDLRQERGYFRRGQRWPYHIHQPARVSLERVVDKEADGEVEHNWNRMRKGKSLTDR